jgi:hypothetical protein
MTVSLLTDYPALLAAHRQGHRRRNPRLLYGSDYCWTPAAGTASQIASIDAAGQPDGDTWRALTSRNAGRLFPRLSGEPSQDLQGQG